MARTMATCHPDLPQHAKGLCRPCYIEKRKTDRAAAKASGDAQPKAVDVKVERLTPSRPAPKPGKPTTRHAAKAKRGPKVQVVDVGNGPEEAEIVDDSMPTIGEAIVNLAAAALEADENGARADSKSGDA